MASPQRFGPFLIARTLGRGGMGEVFVARTPWPEAPVAAIKRLRPDVARLPSFAERFEHEAQVSQRLQHPNVVRTLHVGAIDGQSYVASELVLGRDVGTIADRLQESGKGAPAAVAVKVLQDVLQGLAYVHGVCDDQIEPMHLVHRDITPGNILLGVDGVARIADFGLSKSTLSSARHLTSPGELLGTPSYLAPEVIRGEAATPASDLYGLGAVIYRLLTGSPPHGGPTAEALRAVLEDEPRSLAKVRPDLPEWLSWVVHRLLTKAPENRPSDALHVLRDLAHQARASGTAVTPGEVGTWLTEQFPREFRRQQEEVERLRRNRTPTPPDGTAVRVPAEPLRAAAEPVFDEAPTEAEVAVFGATRVAVPGHASGPSISPVVTDPRGDADGGFVSAEGTEPSVLDGSRAHRGRTSRPGADDRIEPRSVVRLSGIIVVAVAVGVLLGLFGPQWFGTVETRGPIVQRLNELRRRVNSDARTPSSEELDLLMRAYDQVFVQGAPDQAAATLDSLEQAVTTSRPAP